MEASNHREFTRVPVHVRAEVTGGGLSISGSATQNLSLKGMLLICSERLPEATECRVTLFLGDGQLQIQAEGTVSRATPEGLAIQFTRIIGLESLEHLRNLLLLNSRDTDKVELELNEAAGIHRKG